MLLVCELPCSAWLAVYPKCCGRENTMSIAKEDPRTSSETDERGLVVDGRIMLSMSMANLAGGRRACWC
jgi:hypothetical protein